MTSPLILVGSDYKMHRQLFTGFLRAQRPNFAVREVAPDEMDAKIRADRPWLVICSRVTRAIEDVAPAWIMLPLEGHEQAAMSVQGERREMPIPPFLDMLDMIDVMWATVRPQP